MDDTNYNFNALDRRIMDRRVIDQRIADKVVDTHMLYIRENLNKLNIKMDDVTGTVGDIRKDFNYMKKDHNETKERLKVVETQSKRNYAISGLGGIIGGFIAMISKFAVSFVIK